MRDPFEVILIIILMVVVIVSASRILFTIIETRELVGRIAKKLGIEEDEK